MSDINVKALHTAQYEAEQLGKELHLVYWLRDCQPNSAAYFLGEMRGRLDRLVAAVDAINTPLDEPAAPSVEEVF